MPTMRASGRVLFVTLTPEETVLWKAGDTRDAARFRLTIKRPARQLRAEKGLAGCVVRDHEGNFLEDVVTLVRRVDPNTIRQRCEVRGVWPPFLPPASRYAEIRAAVEGWTDAEDIKAWLHEASMAVAASPDAEVDLDPRSEAGAAIVHAANTRLFYQAIGENPDVG